MKVYLIGAGPGDPGLLTLKGRDILAMADTIVYDYLAADELLAHARKDAEIIYVGKKGGDHTLPQDGINSLIIQKAKEGKIVARLKGGDPYMFGRGGEEAEELLDAGVPFEVVPGVTSAVAGPAYAGIPLTHRSYASSVCFATGHEDPTKPETAHNWDALANGGSTLVFFMGMKNLPEISRKLIAAGMPANTPAALVNWGTTVRHRSLVADISSLPQKAIEHGFSAPSLIVVGDVVQLHDRLNWFEHKPLLGKIVVVTRAREQAGESASLLAEKGAEVIQFPTIAVEALYPTPSTATNNASLIASTARVTAFGAALGAALEVTSEDKFGTEIDSPEKTAGIFINPAREAIIQLAKGSYDWILFTSVNAVRFFWEQIEGVGLDSRIFGAYTTNGVPIKIAAVGKATAKALQKHGLNPDFIPQSYVAESMAEGLIDFSTPRETIDINNNTSTPLAGQRILLPRAVEGRDVLPKELEKHGASVEVLPLYTTRLETSRTEEILNKLEAGEVDCITFGSSSTVTNFFSLISPEILKKHPEVTLACIGPITAETLQKTGFDCQVCPTEFTIPAMVDALIQFWNK